MKKRILPFIMVMLMIFTALPISASASTLYYGKTINSGETYTDTSFEMWCWYGNETFTNNGTVNISNGFTLGYQASFVNNSEFTFTGSNSTFGVSSGCSFQNNGTARISGCYNLGLEDSFVNTGTLYLSDISNFNVSGVVNTGKIVCGNGVPDRLIDALKEKSSGDGTVVKEGESTPSTSTKYTITYDLNGGSWKNTPDESIYSYYYKTNDATPYYKIGFDKPFDTLNSNLERDNYDFIGWTCDKDSSQTPSKYLDIMTNWQSNITLTAHWQPKQQYVYYYLDGGVFSDDITTPEIIKHESGISYSLFNIESDDFTLPTPTKPGYDFIGWGVGGTSDVYSTVTITKGTVGNQSYTAKWKASGDTPYTVNVYYMDKNGQYQEKPDRTKTEIGATDTTATVPDSAYIKNGFSFDATKSSNSGTITGDGKLQLSLYYTRNQYDITFKSYDGSETLYSYKGYYDTKIEFKGDEPTIEDEDYIYTFTGWTTNKNYQHPLSLGTIAESQTFYAVFDKEATFCLVNFVDTTGFAPLENTTYKLKKGDNFSINLYLANEKYYVGTEQWGLTFNELFVEGKDGKGLKLGTDFTYSFDGYGKPVVLSIPNVTKDLNITFTACYHETHDYNPEFDVIKENATCSKEGEVLRTCYKCGKVVSEKISVAPDNHTDLKHIEAKAATKTSEGNIEYWYCEGCGKYYKDAKATQEITKEQIVTAKLPSDNNTSAGGSTGNNNKPSSNATTSPQIGTSYTISGNEYKVSKPGAEVILVRTSKTTKNVTVPAQIYAQGITYKVTSIGAKAFNNNKKLTKVTIGTNIVKINSNAFFNCKNLKTVTIKSVRLTRKTANKKAFKNAHKKLVIRVPKKVKKIYKKIFKGLKVKAATSPQIGTSYTISGNEYKVSKPGAEVILVGTSKTTKNVTVPAQIYAQRITYKVTSIGAKAFNNNKKLTKVTIGTNIVKINSNAFFNCKNLKTVTIKSVLLTTKTASKKAFKNAHKKLVIQVPKKVKKNYTKIFKGLKVK